MTFLPVSATRQPSSPETVSPLVLQRGTPAPAPTLEVQHGSWSQELMGEKNIEKMRQMRSAMLSISAEYKENKPKPYLLSIWGDFSEEGPFKRDLRRTARAGWGGRRGRCRGPGAERDRGWRASRGPRAWWGRSQGSCTRRLGGACVHARREARCCGVRSSPSARGENGAGLLV